MPIRKLDGGEELVLVELCSCQKLCDMSVIDVITEDSRRVYDKDDLLHTAYTVSTKISEDLADIRRLTGLSSNKICRGVVMHGTSIIQGIYDSMATDIDTLAGKLTRVSDMPYVRKMANPVSITHLDYSTDYPVRSNARFVDWTIAYLGEFGARALINRTDMIKSAFCFSLGTWHDAINIDVYNKEMKNFDDYMTNKIFILDAVYNRYEERDMNQISKSGSL
jgi:hypothetical protein